MKIVSPSYRRAGITKVQDYFGKYVTIAVHKFEEKEYRKALPKGQSMLIIPDKLRGNLCHVRNWIKENCGDKHLIMCDDDLEYIGFVEKGREILPDAEDTIEFLKDGFRMCEETGTVLWGLNVQCDLRFYRARTPFSFTSVILDPFTCQIIDKEIKYSPDLVLKCDYDYFLQVIKKYRRVLRFNKWHYKVAHLTDIPGGCATYRTIQAEKETAERLVKKWGRDIVRFDFNRSVNPKIFVPIKGV